MLLVIALVCGVVASLPLQRADAQTGALVLESFAKSQNFDWTLSGDGRSAGKDGEWGRQEVDFAAPASIPVEGVGFTWTLRATAKVSNLATECETRGAGLTVTATPGTHVAAFSPTPGETATVTVSVFVKPTSIKPGVTAQLGVSCFSNFGVTFLYRSSVATTTLAPSTTQPARAVTCAARTLGTALDGLPMAFAAGIATQAIEVDCTVTLTITSPGNDPVFARVAPGTTVWVRSTAAGFLPGDRVVVRGRLKDGTTWDVFVCRQSLCDIRLRSPKPDSWELTAVHLRGTDSSEVAKSSPAFVTWATDTKTLNFDWTVPERLKRSSDGVNKPDQVSPQTWPVDVHAPGCPDPTKRGTTYAWTYTSAAGTTLPLTIKRTGTCRWRAEFDGPGRLTGGATGEGVYAVTVKVTTIAGATFEGTRNVTIEDWLVLGLGDSLASGEGVPIGQSVWNDLQCDRSSLSYQTLAARQLEERDTKSSVTFVHLGCSGASIDEHSPNNGEANGGLLTPYIGINPARELPSQLDTAKRLVGGRKVDAVLLSAGVNDAEFGNVIFKCASPAVVEDCDMDEFTDSSQREWDPLPTFLAARFGELPALYKSLDDKLGSTFASGYTEGRLPANRVFITEYPNILQNDQGEVCPGLDVSGLYTFEKATLASLNMAEVFFLLNQFFSPLNRAVVATQDLGWRIIPTSTADFAHHGYCAAQNWVVTSRQSLAGQGNVFGTFHPNRRGHVEIGKVAFKEISAVLRPPS